MAADVLILGTSISSCSNKPEGFTEEGFHKTSATGKKDLESSSSAASASASVFVFVSSTAAAAAAALVGFRD